MMKNFVNAINEKLENEYSFNVTVSIECPSICLQNCHTLEVFGIEENETSVVIDDEEMSFSIGKNYTEVLYDEYEDEYTFKYENGVVLTVAII